MKEAYCNPEVKVITAEPRRCLNGSTYFNSGERQGFGSAADNETEEG